MDIGSIVGFAESLSIGTALAVITFWWRFASDRKRRLIERITWENGIEHRLTLVESSTSSQGESLKEIGACLQEIKIRLTRIEEKLRP